MQDTNLTLAQLNEVSGNGRAAELEEKHRRIAGFLDQQQLDGVLLRRHENLAWATAGQVQARVGIPSETGVAALLLLKDGQRFYLAPENEAPRMAAEEFTDLGYQPVLSPWYDDPADPALLKKLAGEGRIGSDSGAGVGLVPVDLGSLRAPLTEPEIARFRWLGATTASVVEGVLQALEPGDSEYDMEGVWWRGCCSRTASCPRCCFMAVDDRILKYKHAVARGAELQHYGMINLCTRKWGLAVSITRFVHFGEVPAEVARGFAVAAEVKRPPCWPHAARVLGPRSCTLWQRGPTPRLAFPAKSSCTTRAARPATGSASGLRRRQATRSSRCRRPLPGTPAAAGARSRTRVLVTETGVEVLTATPELPLVETNIGGVVYQSTGVLQQG